MAPGATGEPNLTKSLKWSVAGLADLNGDGRVDILLRHEDGRWHYYPMNGSLAGAGRGSVTGVTRNLDWHLAGLGDLDGDGRNDVLLRHVEGRWTYYPMNGRNVAAGRGAVSLTPNTAWSMSGLGDLNGDGRDDVLVRHDDGRWTYYPLDGRTILAGRGVAGITRNPDWSTTGPDPEPDEATKEGDPFGRDGRGRVRLLRLAHRSVAVRHLPRVGRCVRQHAPGVRRRRRRRSEPQGLRGFRLRGGRGRGALCSTRCRAWTTAAASSSPRGPTGSHRWSASWAS